MPQVDRVGDVAEELDGPQPHERRRRPRARRRAGPDHRERAERPGAARPTPGNGVSPLNGADGDARSPPGRPSETRGAERGARRRRAGADSASRPPAPNSHARVGRDEVRGGRVASPSGSSEYAKLEPRRAPPIATAERRGAAGAGAGASTATPEQEQQRPHQVELLLGRQRPEVLDRRTARSRRRSSRRRRPRAASSARTACWRASRRSTAPSGSAGRARASRRAQSGERRAAPRAGSAARGAPRSRRARRCRVRSISRSRCDVIRKPEIDEEDVDADEAAGQRRRPHVAHDDDGDGHRAQRLDLRPERPSLGRSSMGRTAATDAHPSTRDRRLRPGGWRRCRMLRRFGRARAPFLLLAPRHLACRRLRRADLRLVPVGPLRLADLRLRRARIQAAWSSSSAGASSRRSAAARSSRGRSSTSARASTAGGERGLLSIAFPPDYATSRLFYVYYTDLRGTLTIEEYRRSDDPDRADPASARGSSWRSRTPTTTTTPGSCSSGRTATCTSGTGDGGNQGDPDNNAQNLQRAAGQDPAHRPARDDAGRPRDPAGQPVRRPGRRAAGDLGVRLPQPVAVLVRPVTGDLAIGDVGQDELEEVNFRRRGRAAGANFGWDSCEGVQAYPPRGTPRATCAVRDSVRPSILLRHTDGYCSVIGGFVVRDRRARRPVRALRLRRLLHAGRSAPRCSCRAARSTTSRPG